VGCNRRHRLPDLARDVERGLGPVRRHAEAAAARDCSRAGPNTMPAEPPRCGADRDLRRRLTEAHAVTPESSSPADYLLQGPGRQMLRAGGLDRGSARSRRTARVGAAHARGTGGRDRMRAVRARSGACGLCAGLGFCRQPDAGHVGADRTRQGVEARCTGPARGVRRRAGAVGRLVAAARRQAYRGHRVSGRHGVGLYDYLARTRRRRRATTRRSTRFHAARSPGVCTLATSAPRVSS
jgi:hypothetical protein